MYDLIGELAFSTQFGSQKTNSPEELPPSNEHMHPSCIMGIFSGPMREIVLRLPISWLKRLAESRARLRETTVNCVTAAVNGVKEQKNHAHVLDRGKGRRNRS